MNKSEQRKRAREILNSLDEEYFFQADEKIAKAVLQSGWYKESKNVFVYVSTAKEPSTIRIIEDLLKHGKSVFVPKCISKTEMQAVKINSLNDLTVGMFGIFEPKESKEIKNSQEIDLAIVPCVCASRDGKRLGHGAGFYDRFLQDTNASKVCLCYSKLIFDNIQTTELDVPMDYIICEKNDEDT